jgi:hypothetical protein
MARSSALFPKVTISILPPVKLEVDQALRGKARRNAAGAALQDVMIDAMVQNAMLDQTLFEGLGHAYRDRDTGKPIIEDALGTKLTYRKLILGAQVLSRKLEQGTCGRRQCRRAVAEFGRRRRRVLRAADHRPRAGDAQLLGRSGQSCWPR